MIEYITEDILNENIPRDLLAAYRKCDKYSSANHADSDHDQVKSDARRIVKYRYGNATYREISADEALALIRQDPQNVHYIRGIRDGDLVEYEWRGGSKFYNVYGNPNKEVPYIKRDGTHDVKRNIRYITNPAQWIPLLDKIYWTDEYDYPISDEEQGERHRRDDKVASMTYNPVTDDNFNQFRPFDHMARNTKAIRSRTPDTGKHRQYNDSRYDMEGRIDPDDSVRGNVYVQLDPETRRVLTEFNDLKELASIKFNRYSNYRKALKKLERDRDDFDADEYQEMHSEWTEKVKIALQEYQDVMLKKSRLETILKKYSASASDEFMNKFTRVVYQLQQALKNCENLKARIDKLKAKAIDQINTSDIDANYGSDEKALIDRIANIKAEILALIKRLKELEPNATNLNTDVDTNNVEAALIEIQTKQQDLDALKKELFKIYSAKYKELHKQMAEIEVIVNGLKPTRAARKAAKAKAAGQAVLDPDIAGIIQFEDEEANEHEEQPA